MRVSRSTATVQPDRRLGPTGLPFMPGDKVEVVVIGADTSPAKRRRDWRALFRQVQGLPQAKSLTDADIAAEVRDLRSGR